MRCTLLILVFFSGQLSAQQFSDKYYQVTGEADSLLAINQYAFAAAKYAQAVRENKGQATHMDLRNAAKAWALSKNPDSAYWCLHLLAEDKSYYLLKDIETDKAFNELKRDSRWKAILSSIASNKVAMTKTIPAAYRQQFIEGYEILIDTLLFNQFPLLVDSTVSLLAADLKKINALPVKPSIMSFFKSMRFFVDIRDFRKAAEYHSREGEDWLLQNGRLPEMAGCIEICNARNYVRWQKLNQPYMLLHELAHAFHEKVLGNSFTPITEAYNHATQSNLYLDVGYHVRDTVYKTESKAYALQNEKEYFAELTEAYLGQNDFYPFQRQELLNYDKNGYKVLEKVWGKQ
jgi:hypothetical protein